MKANENSDAYKQGQSDAKDNSGFNPPARPDWADCTLNHHQADEKTQENVDYRAGYRSEGGK